MLDHLNIYKVLMYFSLSIIDLLTTIFFRKEFFMMVVITKILLLNGKREPNLDAESEGSSVRDLSKKRGISKNMMLIMRDLI